MFWTFTEDRQRIYWTKDVRNGIARKSKISEDVLKETINMVGVKTEELGDTVRCGDL